MDREIGYNPEAAEPRTSPGVLDQARQKITQEIYDEFERGGEDDPILRAFAERLDRSTALGKVAGAYFGSLIPKSLHPPERPYIPTEQPNQQELWNTALVAALRRAKTEQPRERYEAMRDLATNVPTEEYVGRVENKSAGGLLVQKRDFAARQAGGVNLVVEQVINVADEKLNVPSADLKMVNTGSGLSLDFGDLLPEKFSFAPSPLIAFDEHLDRERVQIIRTPRLMDLAAYRGTKGSEGEFSESPALHRVGYGDLTTEGGVLSLLHEIAHAWQSVYYNDFGRYEFESNFRQTQIDLEVLADLRRDWHDGIDRKIYEQRVLPEYQEKFRQRGIEIDPDHFIASGAARQGNELYLKSRLSDRVFLIKSERMVELINDYVRQERDAWAHAIRVVRLLRQQGFDLVPGIRQAKDFTDHIDPLLDTYQKSMEAMIESGVQRARFSRRR